jgi:hypothetical protein
MVARPAFRGLQFDFFEGYSLKNENFPKTHQAPLRLKRKVVGEGPKGRLLDCMEIFFPIALTTI